MQKRDTSKRKLIFYVTNLLFLCFSLVALIFFAFLKTASPYPCKTNLIVVHDDTRIDVVLGLDLSHQIRTLSLNGSGRSKDGTYIFDREIHVNYQKMNNSYNLLSTGINYFMPDTAKGESIENHLPRIFSHTETRLVLVSKPFLFNGSLLLMGGAPVAFCTK